MCIALPKIVKQVRIKDKHIVIEVEIDKKVVMVDATLIPDVKEGEYVLIQSGVAVQHMEKKEAEESLRIWEQLTKISNK